MPARISIQELTKVFPVEGTSGREIFASSSARAATAGVRAVDAVSLTIEHGERVGIVGANGAGKSTLLHMIAGLSSPTSGTVEIDGRVTSVMTLGVGLREDSSGRENIYIDGAIQGRSRAEVDRVADAIVAFSELNEFIDHPVRTYSTGMKARLAFSMISHIDPEILIIDEALSAGDAAFSAKASARIREICARGQIVIVVSHSMQAIRATCNRCLWMKNGRVVMDGSPDAVTDAYIHAVMAADEAQLLEKFRRVIGVQSTRPGWQVTELSMRGGESADRRALLEAGLPARIDIRSIIPESEVQARVRVRILRLDGVLVFDESFAAEEYRLHDRSVGIGVAMNPLVLGAATYRVDATLESGGDVCASASSVFEVFSLNPPGGGRPMLLYRCSAYVAAAG
jgi:lipopolysaccharide transport system ATP-binding protein